ncbi:MAG: AraC family transcriptional regulator [Treponema sp.]|jgi:AraC-like DNA-binding protein|nr:AraC family transcriptional regulator [Treponema sp.]
MALPANGCRNGALYERNLSIKVFENAENEDYPLHWHTAIEIIIPLKYDYQVFLLNKSYKLRENDILIIPSCESHSITVPPSARGGKRIILMFEPFLFYSLPGLPESLPVLYSPNLLTPEDTPEMHKTIRSLLLAIYDEFLKNDTLKLLAIYVKIIELFISMARHHDSTLFPDVRPYKRQKYIARLNAVFEYIHKHVSEELTLERVAGIAHVSKYHFERIFKKYTNSSFHQYLKYLRIKRAESLLLNPEMTITEVAQEAGFESIATFNRAFKEIRNCTPSEYKKTYPKTTPPPPPNRL